MSFLINSFSYFCKKLKPTLIMSNKKVLIVSPKAFGYVHHIYDAVKKHKNVDVELLYLEFDGYKNGMQKIQNFLSKSLKGVNLKHTSHFKKSEAKVLPQQDQIVIIRPDFLDDDFLNLLKSKTKNFTAYYWDSAQRIKRKQEILHFFDKIYSFDKVDVKAFNLEFITNYIFETKPLNENPKYLFFNISGNDDDYRYKQLKQFANYLISKKWNYNFISVFHKPNKDRYQHAITIAKSPVKVIDTVIFVDEVIKLIEECKILVEFQRKQQIGLSFRVFEALGAKKKLITNNPDIVNYDFYNPQNIFIIDEENPIVPDEFVNSPYAEVPQAIVDKYHIDTWVKTVFNLD